jgi:hypothetical protein
MNLLTIAHRLCIIILLGSSGHALADSTGKAEGTIALYFRDGTPQCSFSSESRKEYFVKTPKSGTGFPCKQLSSGGYFELRNFPSATRIWLIQGRPKTGQLESSPKHCGLTSSEAFKVYQLLTIKEPTTTLNKIITLDLDTLSAGDVITPGLRLIGRQVFQTAADPHEINCIIIEASP